MNGWIDVNRWVDGNGWMDLDGWTGVDGWIDMHGWTDVMGRCGWWMGVDMCPDVNWFHRCKSGWM